MTTPETTKTDFYIVDFDRTLVDSDKLFEVFIEIAHRYFDIPREQIEKANEDMKARGDSFDTAGYVREHLYEEDRGDEWKSLKEAYIKECQALNMLIPGASELIQWLESNGKQYGILTYGNPMWQGLKITAAGFDQTNHIVMVHKEKGRLISSWQDESGMFRLPEAFGGGLVDTIVMIDDKAISFSEYPPAPSKGFWVLDPQNELPSQKGSVQENVA
ncbi:HAD hydrolase-like protein, partial [Candidatus Saccharibacteria bacterium]|nr:HAD hydrolase-like protein [Candidatus Saccharibacteria bacterium]